LREKEEGKQNSKSMTRRRRDSGSRAVEGEDTRAGQPREKRVKT